MAAKYPHACYVISDGATGQVRNVCALSARLVDALELAGDEDVDVRVALHGCELAWWFLLRPSENSGAVPGHESSGMFRKRDGGEYDVRDCRSDATAALDLETLRQDDEGCECEAHMVMASCGVLATTDDAGRREAMKRAQAWHRMPCRELRKRRCKARLVANGYCRCSVPCDLVCRTKEDAGEEDNEQELEVVAEADDDEETMRLLEQIQWLGGSRKMMERVAERRACRFYGGTSVSPQEANALCADDGEEEEPWRLEPLRGPVL